MRTCTVSLIGARTAGHGACGGWTRGALAVPQQFARPLSLEPPPVTGLKSEHTHLVNQHKHQSIFVINQVLNLLEHPSYQLAALEAKHSLLPTCTHQAAWCARVRRPRRASLWPQVAAQPAVS